MMNMYYSTVYPSPIGEIFIVCDDEAICKVSFQNQNDLTKNDDSHLLDKVCQFFDDYFQQNNPKINFKLKTQGSNFKEKVWSILRTIPYGNSITYGEIASLISPTMSPQAVGGAVGNNPIVILIPCHRVLGANGKLTGYAGGLDKKRKLLDLEKCTKIYCYKSIYEINQ